jgi:Ca-activated chloride channel family protein
VTILTVVPRLAIAVDFAHPERLWLLLILPPLIFRAARGRARRARDWAALGRAGPPPGDGSWGWVAAIGMLVLALAQPRWGRDESSALPAGHDVVLLVDVSRSMGAEDAVPDRLGVAVEAAEGLLAALAGAPGDRAAVVAFAGRGVVRCPLTENLGAAADALRALRPGDVQPGGTDLAAALEAAVDAFGDEEHTEGRTVVVLSDGEDLAGAWPRALDRLRQDKVIVHTIAIGDADRGAPVPVPASASEGGGRKTLTYQGQPVVSRRSDEPLAALARATGGAFLPLGLARPDLGRLYRERIAPVARRRREVARAPERVERYAVFLVAALTLGLAGSWPRRRRLSLWLLLVLAVGAGPGPGTAADAVAAGESAFAARDFREALAAFERAIALDPAAAIPRYDAAAALYQLGRHREAAARYREARLRAEPGLRTKVDYALGNTALALGDVAAALGHYDDCLASTARGAPYDAVRRDAAINRRFAEEHLPRSSDERGDRTGRRTPSGPPRDAPSPSGPDEEQSPSDAGSPAPKSPPGASNPSSKPDGRPSGTRAEAQPAEGPEAQLDEALANLREARRLRRLAEPPPPAAEGDRKDW